MLIALGLTHLSILFAKTHNINDHPDELRKFHLSPTPSTGGLAIGFSFFIGLLLIQEIKTDISEPINSFLWYFFSGAVLIFATGFIDDVLGLNSKAKFILQTVAALIVIFGIKQELFPHFGNSDSLGWSSTIGIFALLWFWIVANTNMINLIDGVDGLAGSINLTILFGLIIIAYNWEVQDAAIFIIPLAAGIIGFLAFNKPPASVFMGDTGSLLLGFSNAVIALVLSFNAPHWKYTFSLILLTAVPALDTLFSIIRRTKKGVNPFDSDHEHIHHIFQKYFKSPALTDITLGSVSMIFVLTSILLANTKDDVLYFTVLSVLLAVILVLSVIYYYKMDSINSIVVNDQQNETEQKRKIRRITNGKREIKNSADNTYIDSYVKTFKN